MGLVSRIDERAKTMTNAVPAISERSAGGSASGTVTRLCAMSCLLLAFAAAACKSSGGLTTAKAPATFSDQQTHQLRQTVQEAIQKAGIPGAIVGVWAPDRGTWVEAFGVADVAAKTPLTVNHRVR